MVLYVCVHGTVWMHVWYGIYAYTAGITACIVRYGCKIGTCPCMAWFGCKHGTVRTPTWCGIDVYVSGTDTTSLGMDACMVRYAHIPRTLCKEIYGTSRL